MDIPPNELVTCEKNEQHRVLAGQVQLHLQICKHSPSSPPEFLLHSPTKISAITTKQTPKQANSRRPERRRARRPNQAARMQAALAARNQEAVVDSNSMRQRECNRASRCSSSAGGDQNTEGEPKVETTVYRTSGQICASLPNNAIDKVPEITIEESTGKLDIDYVTRRLFEQAMSQVTPGAHVEEETLRLISLRLAQCIERGLTDENGLGIQQSTGQLVPALALQRDTGEVLAYGVGYLVPKTIVNPTTGAVTGITMQHVVSTTAASEEMLQIITDAITQSLRDTTIEEN